MVEAHASPNILTSVSDAEWKTIRRAVAVSFSQTNIQKKFGVIVDKTNMLISRITNLDLKNSVDVDQAALRLSLDVIGLVRHQTHAKLSREIDAFSSLFKGFKPLKTLIF